MHLLPTLPSVHYPLLFMHPSLFLPRLLPLLPFFFLPQSSSLFTYPLQLLQALLHIQNHVDQHSVSRALHQSRKGARGGCPSVRVRKPHTHTHTRTHTHTHTHTCTSHLDFKTLEEDISLEVLQRFINDVGAVINYTPNRHSMYISW